MTSVVPPCVYKRVRLKSLLRVIETEHAPRNTPFPSNHTIVTSPLAIDTTNLRKVFGDNVAVRGLTLQVQRGEVFGFLGPNGAGKTTSIKMLLGLVAPSGGGGQLLGAPIGHRQTRARIGFLPEHFRFHDWLTAREFLTL